MSSFPKFFGASDRTFHDKKLVLERAARIIAISETTKREVSRFYRDRRIAHRCRVSRDRSDGNADPGPAGATLRLPDRYLLYTGQRFHYKNWLFFVRALAEVLLSYEDLKLVCTGPEFSRGEIAYLADLGLNERVVRLPIELRGPAAPLRPCPRLRLPLALRRLRPCPSSRLWTRAARPCSRTFPS